MLILSHDKGSVNEKSIPKRIGNPKIGVPKTESEGKRPEARQDQRENRAERLKGNPRRTEEKPGTMT